MQSRLETRAGEGRSYSNLGNCYNSLEQYDKAIQHHDKSLNIAEQIGDKAGEGCSPSNLGNCYSSLEKAIQYHEKMLITAQLFANKAGEDGSFGSPFNCCVSKWEMFRNISKQADEENVCANLGLNCQCPCHLAVTKLNQMKRFFILRSRLFQKHCQDRRA